MCACVCVVINLFVHHQFQVQKVVDQPELDLTRSLFFCIIQSKDMLTIKNQTWKIVMETFFSLKDQCAINHQKKKMSHWISLALVCKIFSQNICKYNHIKKNYQLPITYKSLEFRTFSTFVMTLLSEYSKSGNFSLSRKPGVASSKCSSLRNTLCLPVWSITVLQCCLKVSVFNFILRGDCQITCLGLVIDFEPSGAAFGSDSMVVSTVLFFIWDFLWRSGLLEYWILSYVRGHFCGCSLWPGRPLKSPWKLASSVLLWSLTLPI